jgi:hypothetical protein
MQNKAGCWSSEAETTNSLNYLFVQIRVIRGQLFLFNLQSTIHNPKFKISSSSSSEYFLPRPTYPEARHFRP